jgi:hypothetical protein
LPTQAEHAQKNLTKQGKNLRRLSQR